jgi:isopenicillin-N N-acyltransferase-like protein
MTSTYPFIAVAGDPYERSRSYGAQARERVHRSVSSYAAMFRSRVDLSWDEVRVRALRYLPAIESYHPQAITEIRGIADGAGLDFEDALALNVRSEVLFDTTDDPRTLPAECTTVLVRPAEPSGEVVLAQNWDWLEFARDTTVVLEVTREDGPSYRTVLEAGLLAKTGMNDAGLAMCTNTLVSSVDGVEGGVPYHVLLRRALDAESVKEAVDGISQATRVISGNFAFADASGAMADLETAAGGKENAVELPWTDGYVAHSNHFRDQRLGEIDLYGYERHGTAARLRRALEQVAAYAQDGPVTVGQAMAALRDHEFGPSAVCSHPDQAEPVFERTQTIASVIYELNSRSMYLASGNPCTTDYVLVSGEGVAH